jgi:hypothetical protein
MAEKPKQPTETSESSSMDSDEQVNQFLEWEYECLRELFVEADKSAEGILNFYLALMTTVFGAIVLIVESTAVEPTDITRAEILICVILIFAGGIGSIVSSSLTWRYANRVRYTRGLDDIRRFLIDRLGTGAPAMYDTFVEAAKKKEPKRWYRKLWLLTTLLYPINAHQFFVALINGLAISAATLLFLLAGKVAQDRPVRSAIAVLAIFALTFTIFNVYSQVVLRFVTKRLNVQLDTHHDMPFFAGK